MELLQPGHNCWRTARADRLGVIIDAADYFVAVRKAMLEARHSIMLIGWDFDPRIEIGDGTDDGPRRLGDFILWLARRRPELQIRLLRWDGGLLKLLFRGDSLLTILRWKMHPRITLHLDTKHPLAASHHQKIVVIDDCLAFCGGIDITTQRWDRRDHRDDDPERLGPDGKPHGPWHDVTTALDGEAAAALGDLARNRWKTATGKTLAPSPDGRACWPDGLPVTFEQVRVAIARTIPKMDEVEPHHEIESAYIDLIASAKRFIYAESQYFASRRVARAIAERLAEPDGPEIVVINPFTADGWLEPIAMDTARARLVEALQRIDRHGRFRVYHPVTAGGTDIYVHAKVMVVDDCVLRIGSSNLNNRSMRLDTECDVIVAADGTCPPALREKIAGLRNDLLAEHLDATPAEVAARLGKTGSLIQTIEALRGPGRSLKPYEIPELSGIEEWLADNEILDPNGPEEIFESLSKRGLFKGWGRLKGYFHRRR